MDDDEGVFDHGGEDFEDDRTPGDQLAAMVRSFLSSVPFCAPENLAFMIDMKLAQPLALYEKATKAPE